MSTNERIIQNHYNKLIVKKLHNLNQSGRGRCFNKLWDYKTELAEFINDVDKYPVEEFCEKLKEKKVLHDELLNKFEIYKDKSMKVMEWEKFICPHEYMYNCHGHYDRDEYRCVYCFDKKTEVCSEEFPGHFIEQVGDSNIYKCVDCGKECEKPDCLEEFLQ
ncbi:MAG: hypothetical protein ABWZ79_05935 [Pedobacter agri]